MKPRYAFVFLASLLLAACATLNVPAPTTWNQRVLAAYNTEDAVTQSVQTLAMSGTVSKSDAQAFHDRALELKNAIDLADQVHANDPTAGEDQLATAISALQALQAELQKRKSP